jgi:hypothetical protein
MRMWELKINAGSNASRLRCRFPFLLAPERAGALVAMHRLRPEQPGG